MNTHVFLGERETIVRNENEWGSESANNKKERWLNHNAFHNRYITFLNHKVFIFTTWVSWILDFTTWYDVGFLNYKIFIFTLNLTFYNMGFFNLEYNYLIWCGFLKSWIFFAANEAFEKVASYGLVPNMIMYLMNDYKIGVSKGTNILFLWSAASNFAPILGAFLSDSYLGRFLTIGLGSLFSLLVITSNLNSHITNNFKLLLVDSAKWVGHVTSDVFKLVMRK